MARRTLQALLPSGRRRQNSRNRSLVRPSLEVATAHCIFQSLGFGLAEIRRIEPCPGKQFSDPQAIGKVSAVIDQQPPERGHRE